MIGEYGEFTKDEISFYLYASPSVVMLVHRATWRRLMGKSL